MIPKQTARLDLPSKTLVVSPSSWYFPLATDLQSLVIIYLVYQKRSSTLREQSHRKYFLRSEKWVFCLLFELVSFVSIIIPIYDSVFCSICNYERKNFLKIRASRKTEYFYLMSQIFNLRNQNPIRNSRLMAFILVIPKHKSPKPSFWERWHNHNLKFLKMILKWF